MEFLAGLALGALIGLVAGLLIADKLRNQGDAVTRTELLDALATTRTALPDPPLQMCPPVLVIAAPRAQEQTTGITIRR